MKVKKYIQLGECALCPHSFKKEKGKLKCNWYENKKKTQNCVDIKDCGCFWKGLVNISGLELED